MTGFVDKVERMPRNFVVERKRSRGAGKSSSHVRLAGPSEDQIQITVVEWLQRRGVKGMHFFHVPNGGLRHKAVAAKLKAMGVVPGEPDVICLYRGRVYGLELKVPGGEQSEDQEHVERQWEQAGATYAVAHGLDYALDTLREWGLLE